jgi:plasmid stabilization system protein ParE
MAKKVLDFEEFTVKLSQNAEKELNEIISFIAKNNPRTALEIARKIKKKIFSLDHSPARGGYVPELLQKNITEFRQLTESPWRIIYRIDDDVVTVLTIIDSRRNTQDILLEKLLKR